MASRHRNQLASYIGRHKVQGSVPRDDRINSPNRAETESLAEEDEELQGRVSKILLTKSSARTNRSAQSTRSAFMDQRRTRPVKIVGKANINHLPDELLLKVFGYLEAGELLTAARVCKRWQPLANDNLLWTAIFEKYGKVGARSSTTDRRQPVSYYKSLCVKRCSEQRNKKALKLLKKISPFTCLPRDTNKALRGAGIYYELGLHDVHKVEHSLKSRDTFYHSMGVGVRWFDLEMPPIQGLRQLRIYSCNPLFFGPNGSAIPNSPYQRSLLQTVDIDLGTWLKSNSALGSDDMVNLYMLPDGLLLATWKSDGELAFICAGLHVDQLVQRCLFGTSMEPYPTTVHKVIADDVDSSYGLHDYQCTVEIRTLRQSIWSQQFSNLCCRENDIVSGHGVFRLIRRDYHTDHVILQKKLAFPWKTDAFKGVIENSVWMEVTVMDETNEPFWCISTPAAVTRTPQDKGFSFDYANEELYQMSYSTDRGSIQVRMNQTDHGEYFITSMDLLLSLTAINQWFGTSYK